MRDILPPAEPGPWQPPTSPTDEGEIDRPDIDHPREEQERREQPLGSGETVNDQGDRPDVLPDVEPPDEQA